MKFPVELAVFAFFYLLIIILFNNEASAEPRGVEENIGRSEKEKAGGQSGQAPSEAKEGTDGSGTENSSATEHAANLKDPPTFENVATADPPKNKASSSGSPKVSARQSSQQNESNPLADLFQITDPTMRTAMASIYGAYQGNDQCSRKAFCMLGNYLKDMPGRDLIFLFMGNYIPQEYSLSYEIFKAAVMYGQNCNVYVCIPDSPPPDAATAARPKVGQPSQDSKSNPNGSPSQSINSNSFPR